MEEKRPTVSVIMNCYNSSTYLREAIDSVYRQDFQDWEIVFFDNHSTDESASIARSYDSKLKYFLNDSTVPLGQARNLAVNLAQGEYIAFLDCDDLWEPSKLSEQIKGLRSPNGKGSRLAYTDSMRIDQAGNSLASFSYDRTLHSGNVYAELIRDCFIDVSSVLMERNVFLEVGGVNENFHQVEDWELWLKVARIAPILAIPQVLTKTRIHPNNYSRNLTHHNEERVQLIQNLPVSSPAEIQAKQDTLKEVALRENIYTVLRSRHSGLLVFGKTFFKFLVECLKSPVITFSLFRRYFNPKMIRVFYAKYS